MGIAKVCNSEGKDVVIACYFANVIDIQRSKTWQPDLLPIQKLKTSVEAQGIDFVLIHNCFDLPNRVDISSSPYFERWLKDWQYLRNHKDIVNVFLVDVADVDMIDNPFPHIVPSKLYVGDEPDSTLGIAWMLDNHQEPKINSYLCENSTLPLLNCGVVGGNRKLVMALCHDMSLYHTKYPQDQTEMGIFNQLMYTKYNTVKEYGRHVVSLFKEFEECPASWWRHK